MDYNQNEYQFSAQPYAPQFVPQPPVTRQHPILFGFLISLIFFATMNVVAIIEVMITLIVTGEPYPTGILGDEWVFQGMTEFFVAISAFLMVLLFGCKSCLKEKGRGIGYGILCSMYFIVIGLLSAALNITEIVGSKPMPPISPAWRIFSYIITFLLVGLTEELYFRGVVANLFFDKHAKDPAGVWTAVLYSGMIFGLMHLSNALGVIQAGSIKDAALTAVGPVVQAISTTAMGILLTAIYYRCRNIWVMVGIHAFIDICAGMYAGLTTEETLSSTIESYTPIQLMEIVMGIVPYIIATAVLLRPAKLREIIDARNGINVDSPQYKMAAKGLFYPQAQLQYPYYQNPAQPDIPADMTAAPQQNLQNPSVQQSPTYQADSTQNYGNGMVYPQNIQYPQYRQPYQSQPFVYIPEESPKKSKISLVRAIIVVVAVMLTLHISSYALYYGIGGMPFDGFLSDTSNVFSYEYPGNTKDFDYDLFERSTGSFEVPSDGGYTFTFITTPGDSSAYVTFTVYESGREFFTKRYGGRCSEDVLLELKAGEEYSITMNYDFTRVSEDIDFHTKIVVK